MKKIIAALIIAVMGICSPLFGANTLDATLQTYYKENKIQITSTVVDDYSWVRRIYLDLAGRIPSYQETTSFAQDRTQNKKEKTILKILSSEDYVNNYYNFWADIFRIRPERLSDDVGLLRSYPYMDYVRSFIREDKPYNTFTESLLTATGRYTDNPATGYFIRDNGMPLDNLANTLQIFIGKDISCAQCHDDPFQDYTQKQFYQMAAFFAPLANRENRKDYAATLKRIDAEIKEITKQDRIDNNVRQLLSANLFKLNDDDNRSIKLPHDYKYPDSKPFDVVLPVSLDGKVTPEKNKRQEISQWITNHPDFSLAIANRIWASLIGKPLLSPEINFDVTSAPEGQILTFLGNHLKQNNYSIKSLIWLIVTSDFYNRHAFVGEKENFHHQAVLVKRLSAYQIWDSFLTLVIPDTNYSRITFSRYSDVLEIDWANVTGKGLLDQMQQIRIYENGINNNFLKFRNIDLVRSAFVFNRNSFVAHFLKEYGSSDRQLIDTANDKGSITQILVIMNSPLIDLVASKQAQIMQNWEKNGKDKEIIFLSVLNRLPRIEEAGLVDKSKPDDLIWVLLNSREFIFRK